MTGPSPSPSLPAFVQPMLASRGTAFDDDSYLFEVNLFVNPLKKSTHCRPPETEAKMQ
jgi:hypothetical protein